MARPLRIDYPGAFHHITTRGVARQDIFFDDEDRDVFLQHMAAAYQRWGVVCHGYCLMTNHYHREVQTLDGHLSRCLQWVNQHYAAHVNRRYQRAGHLFQGRLKSVLVEAEAHVHALPRYIHRNPVRAGMVVCPREYAWSSYRDSLGLRQPPGWLALHTTLRQCGSTLREQQQDYREFVAHGQAPNPLQAMVCGAVLGRDRFVEWPRQKLHDADGDREVAQRVKIRPGVSMEAICQVVCRAYDVSEEVCSARWSRDNDGRDVAIYLARRHARQSLRVIGTYFGELSPSSVRVVHKRLARRLSVESALQDSVQRLEEA